MRDVVAEVAQLLSGDGAALVVDTIDDEAATARLHLDLDGLECADCVLPPDMLLSTIVDSVSRRVGRPVRVVLDDPRAPVRGAEDAGERPATMIVLSPVAEILGG